MTVIRDTAAWNAWKLPIPRRYHPNGENWGLLKNLSLMRRRSLALSKHLPIDSMYRGESTVEYLMA